MLEEITEFFDKSEDKVRMWLSRRPLLYAFIGGFGVVLFWRGAWHTMDFVTEYYLAVPTIDRSINIQSLVWWDGPLSMLLGLTILLLTGIFTSSFIGNEIILSGIKKEKKMVDKTESEMRSETESMKDIKKEIKKMSDSLEKIRKEVGARKNS